MSRLQKNRQKRREEAILRKRRGQELSDHLQHISEHPEEEIKSWWKNVYQLPLRVDEYCPHYAYSANGTMALTFQTDDREFIKKFIDTLNGERESQAKSGTWRNEGVDIIAGDRLVCFVRGWGHLTGCGALALPLEVAALIQDGFIEYIMERISGPHDGNQ